MLGVQGSELGFRVKVGFNVRALKLGKVRNLITAEAYAFCRRQTCLGFGLLGRTALTMIRQTILAVDIAAHE